MMLFALRIGGGKVVVVERGILGSGVSSVSFVAVDGVCKCSAVVVMAINVARERGEICALEIFL